MRHIAQRIAAATMAGVFAAASGAALAAEVNGPKIEWKFSTWGKERAFTKGIETLADIGYLPQVRTVLPDLALCGLDFIASSLNGERWGVPSLSRADRLMIDETLALVGARDLARRPLSAMSGGERQRLLLAQALIGKPQLLLLDEPLISLDARHQEVAIAVVRKVAQERGITVLFSAHELNQLLGTLDRVLYLGNGQAELGTVDEVITAPALSRLYGTDIQVVRTQGHIFVMSRGHDVEHSAHQHDHEHGHHH